MKCLTKNKMKGFKDKKLASRAALIGWRNRRGIVIKVSIKPYTPNLSRACAVFEGKTYCATGKSNSLALDKLFDKLKSESTLQTNDTPRG